MTALRQYQRLESTGLWRESAQAKRQDVVVSFGKASLVIAQFRSGTAVAHWSLPAVTRLNPGHLPALYSPDTDGAELLELDDPIMIDAIEQVRTALARRRSRPRRVRMVFVATTLAAMAALVLWWFPPALVQHTATVLPPATKADIGRRLLDELGSGNGRICNSAAGRRALDQLRARLAEPRTTRLMVVSLPEPGMTELQARALPGGIVLIDRRLVERAEGPEVLAGHAIAALHDAGARDPLVPLLRMAGMRAQLQLLATGALPDGALRGALAEVIARAPETVSPEALGPRFDRAGIPMKPFLDAAPPAVVTRRSDEATGQEAAARAPVLADGEWVALQGICDDGD